jgi:hypothetical protein
MNKQFFEKILPTQGNICVVGIKNELVRPKFAENIDEAMKHMAAFDEGDYNTFFALGTFQGYQRKAVACIAMRAFFIDLDCGKGKPFPSWEDALIKLHKFVSENNFPKPVIVNSGHGIHAYWPFTEEVTAEAWKPYAEKFKQFCIDWGLAIDETVTADAARVLRVPGSRNLKGEPLPVEIIQDAEPTAFEDLCALLGEVTPEFNLGQVDKGLDEDTKAIHEKRRDNFEYDFTKIVLQSLEGTGCAQIKYIIENAATCPEPLWYAGISVAVRCRDGSTAIHQMSDGHPTYTAENTERKAQQSLEQAEWSHGCSAFEKENRENCSGCPYRGKITGPIKLGQILRVAEEPIDPPTGDTGTEEEEAQPIRPNTPTKTSYIFPSFLKPYSRGVNGGIYYTPPLRSTKKGMIQDPDELILPFSTYPIQRLNSPHDGECLLVKVELPHDGDREFLLPLRNVASFDKLKEFLTNNSVTFEPVLIPRIASYFMKWSTFLTSTKRADIMRIQQGWTSDEHKSFVLGTNEYFSDGEIRHCPPSPLAKNVVNNIKQGGTLEEWKRIMTLFNDPGYEWHAFTVLCGFASPLMEFTNVNGVILSLYGKSGYGKTGALYGAMSIWGHPEKLSVFDGTQNALISRMITSKNITYGLDEQTNTDGKVVSHVAYNISSGQPKLRMQASSNQEREVAFITKLIAIITTNIKLKELMAVYKGDTNAEEMRILEPTIQKPMVSGYELTDERGMVMFDSLKRNHGYAGPLYIQELFKIGIPEIRSRVTKEYLAVGDRHTKNAEYRFLSNLQGVAMLAGKIANSMGLLDFNLDRIFKVVGSDFDDIISGKSADDDSKAESVLGDFINRNIQNCLVFRDNKISMEPRNALNITANVDEGSIWISCSAVKEYLKMNKLSISWFEGELTKRGILKAKSRKQMAAGWKTAFGSTNIYAYKIEMNIEHMFTANEEKAAE